MASLHLVFLVAFFLCELLATFNIPSRVNLAALGLACYAAALIF